MRKLKNRNVLLIGGRSKAKTMASALLAQGYKVTVINEDYEDCLKLAEIKELNVICGNGTKPYILDEAGAFECDIAIALTSRDTDNLVACQLCKKKYGIPKTVSVVSDPNKMAFFYEMGVDRVVCAVSVISGIIQQQAFVDDMASVVPAGKGGVQIMEVQITEDAPVAGKQLWEMNLPQEAIIGCVLRGDVTLIPRGDTRILAGDTLVVITGNGQQISTIQALTGK